MNETKEISPYDLVSPTRLDIAVKYLYFKCLHLNYMTDSIESLYRRHILKRTGGSEPKDLFGNPSTKSSIDDYISQSSALLESLSTNGFKPEHALPVLTNGIGNGAHRLAASLVLKKLISVNYHEGPAGTWDFEWFKQNGFDQDDLMRILRGFIDISSGKTAIITLWGTSETLWEMITPIIAENLTIVGTIDLDFNENPFVFSELVKDIYKIVIPTDGTDNISRKIDILNETNLKLRVIVLWDSNQNAKDITVYDKIKVIKEKCRFYLNAILQNSAFVTLHSSDDYNELLHLANTLLSPNNIQRLRQRSNCLFHHQSIFTHWLEEFLTVASTQNIAIENTCIVGSSPLEVLGIRASTDIDFTMISKDRARFGPGVTKLSDNVDIVTEKYHRAKDKNSASDDALISIDELHFFYRGFRFADLNVVYDRKLFSARDKDLKDVALIDIFRLNTKSPHFEIPFRVKSKISNELIIRRFEKQISEFETQLMHHNNQILQLESRIKILEMEANKNNHVNPSNDHFTIFFKNLKDKFI